jgi:hypothetical protein
MRVSASTVEELVQRRARDALWLDADAPAGAEAQQVQPAEGGGVLVLLADRLAEHLYLDVAGLLGQLRRRHALAAVHVQGVEQPDRERARAAQARGGGQVADRGDVDRRLDVEQPQALASDVVLELVDVVDLLRARVVQADRLVEDLAVALDRHVDVAGDRGREDGAGLVIVEGGEVGAAAREGDAQGGARHHHAVQRRRPGPRGGHRACPPPAGGLTHA